jgi:carboxyl-terminal processing protease
VRKLIFILALCAAVVSCGGGNGSTSVTDPGASDPSAACTLDAQRASLDAWMQDQYYWYPQLKAGDGGAQDMDSYFQSMLPNPPDRYSYTQTAESFDQLFTTGWRYGYGYTLIWEPDTKRLRVRNVEPLSPVASLGMQRGDTIVSIDAHTPIEVIEGALPAVNTDGVVRTFVLADAAGTQRTLVVHSRLFRMQPVATWQVMDATRGGQPIKVGYLAYNQFVTYSTSLLGFVTEHMAWAGVSEVVLDLRYNGGGAVITSRDLASMLSGSQTDGATFAKLTFNDKHAEENLNVPFDTAAQRFAQPIEGLKRLVVITSGGTASASEMLINGLKPYMQVVLLGDRTYGKPYGFVPRSNCGTIFNAVNFETVNAQGVGGYSSGMPVDCPVPDDLDHQMGDPQERRLKAALNYIDTGTCNAQAPQAAQLLPGKPRVFGETVPPQMFLK